MIAAVIFCTNTVGADRASYKSSFDFVGFWQGIDPVQGDVGLDSIVPNSDGTFTVLIRAKFRPCPTEKEGFSTGRFILKDGSLVSAHRIITCGDGTVIENSVPVVYKPVWGHDILEVFVAGFSDPVIILHRVSTRLLFQRGRR